MMEGHKKVQVRLSMEGVWVEGTLRRAEATTRDRALAFFQLMGTLIQSYKEGRCSPANMRWPSYVVWRWSRLVCGRDNEEATSTRSARSRHCGGEHCHRGADGHHRVHSARRQCGCFRASDEKRC